MKRETDHAMPETVYKLKKSNVGIKRFSVAFFLL